MRGRCAWFVSLAIAVLSAGTAAPTFGQQPPRSPRVGLLSIGADSDNPPYFRPFFEQVRILGYEEGRNIVFERRFAAGRVELIDGMAADLVRRNVDAIVLTGKSRNRGGASSHVLDPHHLLHAQ